MTTFLIIIGILVIFLFAKFGFEYDKDSHELKYEALDKKFDQIVYKINEVAFNGNGTITKIDKRTFNLYEKGSNQIIQFLYSTGHLTITWRYKYFRKEVVHERQFNNVRNLSLFEQQRIAEQMINEMSVVVEKHKRNVL